MRIQLMDRSEHALNDSYIRHGYGDLGWREKQIPSSTSTKKSYRIKINLEFHQWKSLEDIQRLF